MTRWRLMRGALALCLGCAACSEAGPGGDGGPGGDARALVEDTAARCQNGLDDDGDGFKDCEDQDCWVFSACAGSGPDGRPPGDGWVPPADTRADGGPLPGCAAACPGGTVCHDGQCTAPGPARACAAGWYPASLPSGMDGMFYVDGAHTGTADGKQATPFTTIAAAVAAIPAGKRYAVAVAAGTYDEPLNIGQALDGTVTTAARAVHLYCSCPEQVKISAPVRIGAVDPEVPLEVIIDGCSVVPGGGYDVDAACDWSNDAAQPTGIAAVGGARPLHVLVRNSVVAGWATGLYYSAYPGSATTDPDAGVGGALTESSFCVARSRISKNLLGVDAINAPPYQLLARPFAECEALGENLALVLNRIERNRDRGVSTHQLARGIALAANVIAGGGRLCGKQGGEGYGVYLGDTDSAAILGNLVRDNADRGIGMRNENAFPSKAFAIALQDNVLDANGIAGIALQKMQAELEILVTGNVVRGTAAPASGAPGGDGIQISTANAPIFGVRVERNTVLDSARHGLFYDGATGAVLNNTVKGSGGYGCVLQQSSASVGTNAWGDNLKGDVQNYTSPVEKYGSLPVPIP